MAWAIGAIVKAWRKELATPEKSGERLEVSSYTDAIDEWISIADARKALEQSRADAQDKEDAESKVSEGLVRKQFQALDTEESASELKARRMRVVARAPARRVIVVIKRMILKSLMTHLQALTSQ